MMLKTLCLSVGMVLAGTALSAKTPVIYTDDTGSVFRVDVPDFWSMRTGGPRVLTEPGTDDARIVQRLIGLEPINDVEAWVGLISPLGVGTIDQGMAYLQEIGPFLVTDVAANPPRAHQIGGRPARSVSGSGRREGRQVAFTATVVDLPSNRVAIAIAVYAPGIGEIVIDEINAMLRSIRGRN